MISSLTQMLRVLKFAVIKALAAFETRCIKRMVCLRKHKDLSWVQWHRQCINVGSKKLAQAGRKTLSVRFCERLLKFAHGLFGSQGSVPIAMVRKVVTFRSTTHWKTCEALAAPSTPKGWKHPQNGRLRIRWDEVFIGCLGERWEHLLS